MSYNIFYKLSDYFLGADIRRENQEAIKTFEKNFPVIAGGLDNERETHLSRLKGFNVFSSILTAYFPNLLDAAMIGKAIAEERIPYEILAVEACRFLTRRGVKIVIEKIKGSLEEGL